MSVLIERQVLHLNRYNSYDIEYKNGYREGMAIGIYDILENFLDDYKNYHNSQLEDYRYQARMLSEIEAKELFYKLIKVNNLQECLTTISDYLY